MSGTGNISCLVSCNTPRNISCVVNRNMLQTYCLGLDVLEVHILADTAGHVTCCQSCRFVVNLIRHSGSLSVTGTTKVARARCVEYFRCK